jgi:hypothetical protein
LAIYHPGRKRVIGGVPSPWPLRRYVKLRVRPRSVPRIGQCNGTWVIGAEKMGNKREEWGGNTTNKNGKTGNAQWAKQYGVREIQQNGLLTCQLVSGRPETSMRKIVRRGRGRLGRSIGLGIFSLRRGPRANWTVRRSPLKSLPSVIEEGVKGRNPTSDCTGTYEMLKICWLATTEYTCYRHHKGKISLPGTTSLASIASSYSMKPKPFMSLISVIFPEPWLLKCSSTSCLVTVKKTQRRRRAPSKG